MRLPTCLSVLLGTLAAATGPALAVPVDGILDPAYGPPLATQSTQTSYGDSPEDFFYGSELDGAFGYVTGDTLYLLATGNFSRFASEPLTFANQLQLWLDTQAGGQNPVSGANPSVGVYLNLRGMAGMGFDAEFAPDYWIAGARDEYDKLYAYYAELPAGGGGAGYRLGASVLGGTGTLSGVGTSNPHGILASVDISNTAGVTTGCDAGSGAGVTTGVEWAIPLAAIGNPTGSIRVCALLANAVAPGVGGLLNQVLGPVPPGTCTLGHAPDVDFASIPGAQYFTIDITVPVTGSSWGRVKTLYR